MKFVLFIILAFSIFALLSFYISKRFINKLDIKERNKKYLKIGLISNLFGIAIYIYARYNPIFPNEIFFLLSLPIGILFLFFCVTIIYDISRVIIDKTPMKKSRRRFFKKSLDISSFILGSGLVVRSIYEAKHIEIEDVEITIKNLNQEYKIVQLSDIHIGGLIDEKFISNIVKKVNNLKPDLVVITGDLVDISLKYAKPALNQLTKLKSIYGTYFIVGNHEYIHGVVPIINEVKSLGIKVLENENIYIGQKAKGFNLLGVYDVMGYRVEHHIPDLTKALIDIDKNSPTILLAHQPKFINEVYGVDLMLSGHTHGGQIYPFKFLVNIVQPYIDGLHQHSKRLQIYVNKGTGFWGPPMRLGSSCEITNINIKPISKKRVK